MNNKIFYIFAGVIILIGLISFSICFKRIKVEAGQQVVLVKKPMFFGHGGVVKDPIKTGSIWVARTTEGWDIPIIPRQYEEKFDDMATKNTTPVDFNAYIKLKIINGPYLIEYFGAEFYENNIKQGFRNLIRSHCRFYTMDELVTNSDVTSKIEADIQKQITEFISKAKIPVIVEDVVIGKVSPNKEVMDEINATAAQQQREKTEVQRAKAEVARKEAELKRAAADNAYRQEMQLNPSQFIQLEAVKNYSDACMRNPNCTMVVTQSGSPILVGNNSNK